ncbi:mucin-22-like [Haliotis rufescens]|uniref:mucin-22-like n=1 Tax=Haliotis rufescens TaxID=6454 RepID=UPI00201F3F3E|nr:mucin-22-like [Haliotis rufescens]
MAVTGPRTAVFLFLGLLVSYSRPCTYTTTSDTGGDQALWHASTMSTVANIGECQDACTADTACISAEFLTTAGSCFRFQTATALSSRANSIYTVKDCSAPTTTGDLTTLSVAPTTTGNLKTLSVDPCSMTRTSNTKGGVTDIQLTLSTLGECSTACLYLSQCMGVTYSGGTCSIYGESITAMNSGDTMDRVKYPCPFTGKTCCMEDTTNMKASAAALMSLTASLETCEMVCLNTSSCMSVYFKNNVCYLYTAATTTSADTGSTHSVRTCTGTPTTTGDLTTLCVGSGADVSIVSSGLGVVILAVIAVIHREAMI